MRNLILALFLLLSTIANSQKIPDRVDIGHQKNDDKLEIYLIPNYDFNGVFSSIVFSIRSNGSIGRFIIDPQISDYVSVSQSGSSYYNEGLEYKTFAGFGFVQIQYASESWVANSMVKLGEFLIDEKFDYELINDLSTDSKNGNFYISLNGIDVSGNIISFGSKENSILSIYPNPFSDQLFIFNSTDNIRNIEVLDLTGKVVMSNSITQYPMVLDTKSLSPGSYTISIILKDGSRKSKKSIKI